MLFRNFSVGEKTIYCTLILAVSGISFPAFFFLSNMLEFLLKQDPEKSSTQIVQTPELIRRCFYFRESSFKAAQSFLTKAWDEGWW